MDHNAIMTMNHLCLVCGSGNVKVMSMSYGDGVTTKTECPDCKAVGKISNASPWKGMELPEKLLRGMFAMAGIEILDLKALQNGYWGNLEDGAHPWWFVKTPYGWIEIGWRKRVLSIDWSDTPIRKVVTEDETTKTTTMVHAWTEELALEYLKAWRMEALKAL